ncbi:MAG: PAS domain S-box protein, partial [Bellilinea sp.]|nr:PAS domain S-box protein [Bellilinea sp.]
MFPSKIVIASSDHSLNLTLKNFLQKSGWDDIRIFESVDGILDYCCLTNQDILIFFYANLAPPTNLVELLQLLRRNFQALLILIINPHQVDDHLQEQLGKVIDGFIIQPVTEYSLTATLHMARERRQRELDLLRSEEKFQRLFQKSSEPSFLLHNQIFIDCNQAAMESLRADRTEIIGKSPAELSPEIQPDGNLSVEKAKFYIDEAMKTGFTQFHWLHRRLDGSEFLVEVSLTAIPYAGDLALYAKWRDITEIEQYKKSLQISEQRYRQLFETMLNGFALHEVILDDHNEPVDYRFIVVNPAFEKLTGLKAEDIIGKRVLEVLPNTEPYWIETYGRVALTGDPVLIE